MKKLFYPLTALIIFFGLLAFQDQNQKYYYAFDKKIPLTEVDNKLVIRYNRVQEKEKISSSLRNTHSEIKLEWQDETTAIITTSSKSNRDKIIKEQFLDVDVISS